MRWFFVVVSIFLGSAVLAQEDLALELKDVNWIGFQQFREASRIFIKTTEPVKYRIESVKADLIVLVIENARIPLANNRRPLDTHFFDSPIVAIVPKVIEDASPSVNIEIYLRRPVPFKEIQNDTFLALDFQRH